MPSKEQLFRLAKNSNVFVDVIVNFSATVHGKKKSIKSVLYIEDYYMK